MNNLRQIRELYGATQDEIATVVNVNRVTISNWENSTDKKISNSNMEKLSLYYGIGPEFFYDEPLNDKVREMLIDSAKRQKELEETSDTPLHKADEFRKVFSSITFDDAVEQYMLAMKLFMTTVDNGSLDKLEIALKINKKMGARLENAIELRKKEQSSNEESLFDLLESLISNQ